MRDAPIAMVQGEALQIRIPVVDADEAPLSLTGASISWVVSATYGGAAVITKTTAGGTVTLETTSVTNDTVVVTLAPADTSALSGAYVHEAAITGAAAASIVRGDFFVMGSTVL